MRKAALLFVIAVWVYAAKAQFTLQPRLGFETPLTKISYNNSSFYKAVSQSLPQAGVRADYQFKKGFAPYLGVFTHRPLVSYSFNDPKTGMSSYSAAAGDLQVQLQAGLQYTTKAIALNKKKAATTSPQKVSETKSSCCHSYGGCHKTAEAQASKQQGNSWTLRLQPSAGLGYIPSGKGDLETANSASYQYNAGNSPTEFITGLGFELAKNKNPFITLALSYFKGLGTNETVLLTESAGKPVSTNLRSKLSGWNAAIGIPISFAKKSKTTNVTTKKENNSPHRCTEYYRSRCGSYKRIQ
ncbi:MAG: hypothetical protein J7502_00105 [Flavisolibacter sp.]|nr:hypothetical protein [Flavisolibacter sp.]